MTIDQTVLILDVFEVAYPRFYANQSEKERFKALTLWAEMLSPYPFEICAYAAKRLIAENKFPPAISEVTDRVKELMCSPEDDAVSTWNVLAEATTRASITTQDEFEALPYEIQRFCGSLSGLRSLGQLDSDIFNTVTRGQFMKVYGGMKRSRETLELMSPELLALARKTVTSVRELPEVGELRT